MRSGLRILAAVLGAAVLAGCQTGLQEAGPPQGPPAPDLAMLERKALEEAGKAYLAGTYSGDIDGMPRPDAKRPMEDPLTCLARNAYFEAKGEGARGMTAVIHVTLNRMAAKAWPSDACSVVRQGGRIPPCQFSWYCDFRSNTPKELGVYAKAHELAWLALNGQTKDPTGGATMFHNPSVSPRWARAARKTVAIGNHVFYRLN